MLLGKYINKYYKKYALLYIIGVCACVFVDYIQLIVPELLGELVGLVKTGTATVDTISGIVKSIVLVAIGLCIGRVTWRLTIFRASNEIESGLRHDMFLKAERLSQKYYHNNKVGNIMSWFTNDIEAIEEYTGFGTVMIVDAIFLSIIVIIKMIKLDWAFAILTFLPLALIVIWGNLVEKAMSEKWEERQKKFDEVYDFSQENFSGIRVIKAFVKETQEILAFSKVAKKSLDANIAFGKVHIGFDVLIELVIGLIFALITGFSGYFIYLTVNGAPFVIFNHEINLTAEKFVVFTGYFDTLIWPLIAMGQIVAMRARSKTSLQRITKYLDEDEDIQNCENAIVVKDIKGDIEFKNYSFAYPDSKINSLNNISLKINAGEMIGIVGHVGSGKTTLVNALMRLYNAEKGTIFIDGYDIMEIDVHSLRDEISYAPQDNFLFSDKIENNINFFNRNAEHRSTQQAAEFADVDSNIQDFTEGYETVIGERGTTLSGGQKQRISIARAYIKNAPIMIMDDSVSAVDTKTEEVILNNIKEKRQGKTTIMIASRVSTVCHMDKIIVLNDGKLEAFDTPANLLETSPTYQKMVFLQKLENEIKEEK